MKRCLTLLLRFEISLRFGRASIVRQGRCPRGCWRTAEYLSSSANPLHTSCYPLLQLSRFHFYSLHISHTYIVVLPAETHTSHLHASRCRSNTSRVYNILNVRRRRQFTSRSAVMAQAGARSRILCVTSISARVSVVWRSTVPRVLCRMSLHECATLTSSPDAQQVKSQ